ncbi:MAG: hypothetical protein Q8O20_06315 [Sulfuricurvum sp.]|uniref:hypothetical protein n=1 Tax=Sulfuricurvum sp. TaxID=2025608 RepID=UPI002735E982|nr:hypothetical protein [Sulfuricurvum sp.]MDP2850672.1 hypothetical protein [Sulfuricurvum sp.]
MPENEPLHKIAQSWATTASLILIPLVLGYMANSYQAEMSRQKLNSDYVALAINILKEDPTQKNKALRIWAINIIDNYSEVKLNLGAREGLIEHTPIITSKFIIESRDQKLIRTQYGVMTEREYMELLSKKYNSSEIK